nr:tumor necrosis factor receptor superfamily member 26-like isoform X1 [Mirounga angustirostris]
MGGGRSALCALWLCALRLCALPPIRGAAVPLPGGEPECSPNEYEPEGLSWCCKQCPAGYHVSADCGVNHGVPKCSPCEPGSFLSHPNGETSCWPCTQCRADQEMVAACTRIRDRQCQCASGSFFCDSPSCVENCFRCRRCPGAVLRPCNVTHNAVCDPEAGTEAPGKSRTPSLPSRSADLPCERKMLGLTGLGAIQTCGNGQWAVFGPWATVTALS